MKHFFYLILFVTSFNVCADNVSQIEHILKQEDPPFGVVFEILENEGDALKWVLPKINTYIVKLRKKFPEIDVAIVSHGSEQFGLMKTKQTENSITHQLVKSLSTKKIKIEVCGTHASWRGVKAEDFPDYVEVVPAGPTAIRHYEEIGCELIVIRK